MMCIRWSVFSFQDGDEGGLAGRAHANWLLGNSLLVIWPLGKSGMPPDGTAGRMGGPASKTTEKRRVSYHSFRVELAVMGIRPQQPS
jgi:hypothetical protein